MRLAAFIRANAEPIAVEWERFAATLMPAEEFSSSVLRNDVVGMLADIAENMDLEQSAAQQQAKSEGEPTRSHYTEGAIVGHVVSRITMGLSFRQFISEFRALRASVIRSWQRGEVEPDSIALDDLIRFNEAIDQILIEETVNYSREVERARELFLSILGHDLRNPLSAITSLAELQLRAKAPEHHARYSAQILVSARRMSHMINDLLELARVRLGSGIVIHRASTSLRRVCNSVVEEMRAVFPDRIFQLKDEDELPGEWDESRLCQVVSNLVSNAVQHGCPDFPVTVTARSGGQGEAEILVHNEGTPISPDVRPKLFNAFYRLDQGGADTQSTSLGLGLYICQEIVAAHGGTIEVRSSAGAGTTFLVRMPSA